MIRRFRLQEALIFFLIWPFGSFLLALINFGVRYTKLIVLLFAFLFGYSVYLYSGDIVRYGEAFAEMVKYDWSDLWFFYTNIFSPEKVKPYAPNVLNTQPDFYAFTVQFLLSRVTENPRWFWALVSVVYTYFFLLFIDEVRIEMPWTGRFAQKVFFVFLVVIVPFYVGVTGVRFWTALFLFALFALRLIRTGEKKNLAFACCSILVHFSFAVPVALLFVYAFIPLRRYVLNGIILFSLVSYVFLSSQNALDFVSNNAGLFDDTSIEDRVSSYSSQELFAARQERVATRNWYVTLRGNATVYLLLFLFGLELMGILKFRSNDFLNRMFPLLVIFFCLTVISFNLGSMGRFKNIFYLLTLSRYAILVPLNLQNNGLRVIANFLLPVLILHIVVTARAGFYYVDPILLVGNCFFPFVVDSQQSLSEFLVGH